MLTLTYSPAWLPGMWVVEDKGLAMFSSCYPEDARNWLEDHGIRDVELHVGGTARFVRTNLLGALRN